ncbi:DNA polymerase [Peribacillus huizhouensis]|uniref:DNA polymerase I n=1 Tax=Peribacillus huizhouensis TaxID=1501239 RepID=A0ABR6CRH4_9BACI|nr:DNA polymerase [Peribacillus huizhouensis]MBA9027560.1 DNA polymerase-1 [Peribacillus huizhouensis]
MELRLNLATKPTEDSAERVKKAAAKKTAASETIEEAWLRILSMKNSDSDQAKLLEVQTAMARGTIGRSPLDAAKRFSKAEALRMYKVLAESQREETLRKMVEESPANYELITTERQFQSLLAELASEQIIAVDTETTGVDVYTDVIVGMSFSLPIADKHVYIPVDHDTPIQLSLDFVLDGLAAVLNDESIGKVLHNAMFDIAMFRRHGSDLKGVAWDTMTAMHLLNENEPSYKLKDLAPKYLGVASDTFDKLFGRDAQFKEVPLDIALVYAAKDTELTWRLYEFQRSHMAKMPTVLEYYQTVEVPLLYVIVDLEANGYILDLDFAKEYGEHLRKRAEELSAELVATLTTFHAGDDVLNLNSTQQMRPALSKAIGQEIPNMDAKKTLKPLANDFEVVAKLLEYKKITKLSGTYIDTLPLKQNPTTKRWHSRFNPMGTVTGRFSSGKDEDSTNNQQFNVQNQPPEARPMFVAPPGKVLVGADFKAQEIRCVAYLSGEPVLINAFLEERDPYAMMASNFYKRPYEEVNKNEDGSDTKERKQMKLVWLATLYGMSDKSLGATLGISTKEATQFKADLFGSMPKLNAWLEGNKEFVRKYGFVWTDENYRKRRLPEAKWKRKNIPYGRYWDDKYREERKYNAKIGTAFRQATNARVQGSSSVQTKVTMLRAHEYCAKKPGWSMWSSVHDELIFEIPEDFTREEAEDIRDIMVNSYRWGDVVPNGTDIEVMRRWGEGVPVGEWFKNKGDE